MNEHYPFTLKPLPYNNNALEPVLSEQTITLHHNVLQQNYVNRLNNLLKPLPQYHDWSLNALVAYGDTFPAGISENLKKYAGGVFNHELYFDSMIPKGNTPSVQMKQKIINSFGSVDSFKAAFKSSAMGLFGSGYTWLLENNACRLQIINTPNQDSPPLTIVKPLLALDMWEHAYYLDNQTSKDKYIDNWLNLINWENAEALCKC